MINLSNFSVSFQNTLALKNASVEIESGERLGIVGESGSGKTMLALSLMGMIPEGAAISGSIKVENQNMTNIADNKWQEFRAKKIAMIFQEPMAALNPLRRVGDTVIEPLLVHEGISRGKAMAKAVKLFEEVGISDPISRLKQYPHELSGGQRQRVLIALALACDPKILIADEPTTALDVTVQKQILNLIGEMQSRHGTTLLFVTHDLGVVSKVCQSLSVLFLGKVIEDTNVSSFFDSPTHPYSKALLAATPKYTDPKSDLIPVSEEILNSAKEEIVQLDLEWSNGR